ncbi:hypothetical protein [Noviherbaspirillum galbum]|uniref:DUF2486 family protein n=1 Tax=Noviherbaspirillum galbum TaxID=2709383 RepID=A0A6B3SNV4_9BURK|nr:hypothetical protein [Noviherbaspirillum galbum]NEX60965.1 hypothetical protein [Noviherbaspirillum galbum]
MSNPPQDAGIPVLTEIIPATATAAPVPAAAPSTTPAASSAPLTEEHDAEPVPDAARAAAEDERWERLEREVREKVLYQLLERIDFVLEQRVRDSLADVLQTAVEKLASEIQGGLQVAMKDMVTRAVAQEITRLQATKK